MPKLSIAIPTYNREDYLKECLNSILNQSYQDFEVYIFDNHSDYDIIKLIASYNDNRFHPIVSEANQGNFENFCKIFNYSFGSDYLMVFHDDDTLHPQALEKEMAVFESNSDLIWIGSGLKFVHHSSQMMEFASLKDGERTEIYDAAGLVRLLLNGFHLAFGTTIYRTDAIEDIRPLQKKFFKWSDRPYMITLAKKGKVAVIKKPLVNYRVHSGQDSQGNNSDLLEYIINLYKFYFNNLPQPITKSDKKLFYRFSTNYAVLSLAGFADNFIDYVNLLKTFVQEKLINWRFINFRGIVYTMKAFMILLKK